MATHSSILVWEILWTEKPGELYSPWGHKRVGHNFVTKQHPEPKTWLYASIVAFGEPRAPHSVLQENDDRSVPLV